jgi:hypothetical protein
MREKRCTWMGLARFYERRGPTKETSDVEPRCHFRSPPPVLYETPVSKVVKFITTVPGSMPE